MRAGRQPWTGDAPTGRRTAGCLSIASSPALPDRRYPRFAVTGRIGQLATILLPSLTGQGRTGRHGGKAEMRFRPKHID